MTAAAPFVLLRDHRPWGGPVEDFPDVEETLFYGGQVLEGQCANLHTDDADVYDRVPRRLIPGRGEGGVWGECADCEALWRVVSG